MTKNSESWDPADSAAFKERIAAADPRIEKFLRVWRDARSGRVVPRRQDIDPTLFPGLLPYVWLCAWDSELQDFVCRLAGERVNWIWGYGLRGNPIGSFMKRADHEVNRARWLHILNGPLVHFGAAAGGPSQSRVSVQRLTLPLCNDDGDLQFLIGLSLYKLVGSREDSRHPLMDEEIIQVPCAQID